MILFNTILATFLLPFLSATAVNTTQTNQIKTKRTIPEQLYANGENKPVVFYMDHAANVQPYGFPEQDSSASTGLNNYYTGSTKPLAFVSVQQPIQVFEQDSPKQVAAQQVLYEFQQTPTNAVSNVHVKQLFQPTDFTTETPLLQHQFTPTQPTASAKNYHQLLSPSQSTGFYPSTSETIVSPVQHNLYTNHGQNAASFNYYNPNFQQSQQFQHFNPPQKLNSGKYIYMNGKIVYQPNHNAPTFQNPKVAQSSPFSQAYHNQQKVPVINFGNRQFSNPSPQNGNVVIKTNMEPPKNLPPITYDTFHSPHHVQIQPIDKPSSGPPKQQEESEDEDERPVNEENEESNEEEDNDDDDEKYEIDNEEFHYETFPFEHEYHEDDYSNSKPKSRKHKDKNRYVDEENAEKGDEERDTKRGSSRHTSKYQPQKDTDHKSSPGYDNKKKYSYREDYSKSSKFKSPNNGRHERPKEHGQYKKVKYSKKNDGKPKIESIEGKYSENIPITHKQKVYKERWFVSKDIAGKMEKKINH